MVTKLSSSVGKKGKNLASDVTEVQKLLNSFASKAGFAKLKVDGQATPPLEKAIGLFQKNICAFRPDHRIDPGKTTIKKLNAGPSKVDAERKKDEKLAEKIKVEERTKAVQAARDAAMKTAKSKSLHQNAWGSLLDDIEEQAAALFDSYFSASEKKGEDPKIAAKTSAEKAKKEARKKAETTVIKVIDTGGVLHPARLTGKTTGVKQPILNVLNEVSSYYGQTIHVTSGLRDKKGQASAMYNNWNSHLKAGKVYSYLRKKEALRLELDGFVTAKDKAGFIDCMFKKAEWKYVSRHLSGQAADISLKTDKKIIHALSTCLHYLEEGNSEGIKCHHFDNRKLVFPVPDSVKAKWKT